jgi:hypothetical protein
MGGCGATVAGFSKLVKPCFGLAFGFEPKELVHQLSARSFGTLMKSTPGFRLKLPPPLCPYTGALRSDAHLPAPAPRHDASLDDDKCSFSFVANVGLE